MTMDEGVKGLLRQADTGLTEVLQSLASAESSGLALGERRLADLVETMCGIERAARTDPSLPIRESLLTIQKMVGHARKLSSAALRIVATQMENRSLCVSAPPSKLCVEG